MAPKKTVKRIKRSLPPRNKDGFDPRLVALGAIGGGVAGRATNKARAGRSVAKKVAADTKWDLENIRSNRDIATRTNDVAYNVLQEEYSKMPRAKNQGGVDLYKTLRQTNDYGSSKRLSGLSNRDMNKLQNKRSEQVDMLGNKSTAGRIKQATRIRATRTNRSSAIKGGIGGAALAALVQLVAKELNKK